MIVVYCAKTRVEVSVGHDRAAIHFWSRVEQLRDTVRSFDLSLWQLRDEVEHAEPARADVTVCFS